MPAYAILDIDVFDKEKLEDYKKVAPSIIKKFQGEIIVRGGESSTIDGDWSPKRIVMIKFPSFQLANEWKNSEAYIAASELRKKGAKTNAIIVEGI